MNKLIFLILFLLPGIVFADLYDEAMKLEAKGNYELSIAKFREYFDQNINDDNQHGIIEKLIYASTLFQEIKDTLSFLEYYVKYMKNENSRYRVYKKIGQIYELSGDNINAGRYYEKAAYTLDDQVDYSMLFDSLDILIESGYYENALGKINSIDKDNLDPKIMDRLYYSLSRAYYHKGHYSKSKMYLGKISNKDSRFWYLLSKAKGNSRGINKYPDSIEYSILSNDELKLRKPSDYIGLKPDFNVLSEKLPNTADKFEMCLGTFNSKNDASGIINLLEQLEIDWFFDNEVSGNTLYIFSEDEQDTRNKLDKLGIYYE